MHPLPDWVTQDGFVLSESNAILQYLCASRRLHDHWYPAAPRERAVVDKVLHWYHMCVRHAIGC